MRSTPPTTSSTSAASQVRATPATTPLFLYLGPQAPHLPATPPARFANSPVTLPDKPPSFNEADVTDKPPPDNAAKPLTQTQLAQVEIDRLNIGRSLLGVNEGLATLFAALADTGRLAGAAMFFTSDNGYLLGEHRLFKKGEPYEEPSRIPFLVRWPGVAGRTEPGLISSVDLSATAVRAGRCGAAEHGRRRPLTAPDLRDGRARRGLHRGRRHGLGRAAHHAVQVRRVHERAAGPSTTSPWTPTRW